MQFSQIIGHANLKSHLLDVVKSEKIPHAQLFIGPEGNGALAMVIAFAQLINCEKPTETDSCGICGACQKAKKMIHPDIHFTFPVIGKKEGKPPLSDDWIAEFRKSVLENPYLNEYDWLQKIKAENKQGNITSLEAKNILRKLSFKNYEGKYRVSIIWKPEALKKEGNILLKLIEEPPANTIIILVAENQEDILPTILSRTQITKINRIEDKDISAALINQYQVEAEKAQRIAFLADGNFREALLLVENEDDPFDQDLKDWLTFTLNNNASELVSFMEKKAGKGREHIKQFLEYYLHFLRECMILKFSNQLNAKFTHSEKQLAERMSRFLNEEKLYLLVPLIEKCHYAIERNCNPKITLLNLSIQMEKILRGKPISTESWVERIG